MNKLNQMGIADLSDQEVNQLVKFEEEMNKLHKGHNEEDIYLLALRK